MSNHGSVALPGQVVTAGGMARWLLACAGLLAIGPGVARLAAQSAAPAGGPDTLVLTSGETLLGHLESANAGSVTFKSNGLGDVTVPWGKIRELRSSGRFAVLRKNVTLHKNANVSAIPQGTIEATAQAVRVTPTGGTAESVPVSEVGHVVGEASFQTAMRRNPRLWQQWNGTVTAGAALIEATQHSVSFNGAVNLERVIPSETWLTPRNRTAINFSTVYGKLSQPGATTIKTSIYSAGIQRDQYFTPRLYGLGKATFDHNFSQGLDLQQIYGGGIGWTAVRTSRQTLDLQAMMDYERQAFQDPTQNRSLAGSVFGELYNRTFSNKIVLAQQLYAYPTWNHTSAFSSNAAVQVSFPVYRRFSFTTGLTDAFLNDPPPGFRQNSFQFTAGLSYALR